ncbi:PA2169 family four-helix-bundle protein [Pseudomonas matsuisoli]|uniref:Chemotaxis protein n=1 Tax=Pseudomonas matsuisoli TaxID=1515666 RepID=A0A917PSC7_9PSED|nr:PA2169 family four-helix-bundle protein [Pseudomonas matsuisoli]GGJ89955.1 chemotaxis protein [Pseudomonas matsuisoli]
MDNASVVSLLNGLIETSLDGESGLRECVDDLQSAHFRRNIDLYAQHCALAANELQQLVRAMGSDPCASGTVSGAVRRSWAGLKSSVVRRDDATILSHCEHGERRAQQHYREVLSQDLPANVRLIVERQFLGVQRDRDEVKAMCLQARVV